MNTKITEIENKMPNVTGLLSTSDTNIRKTENKIPGITGLATKAALIIVATDIENKILSTSSSITTVKFNGLPKIRFGAWVKEAEYRIVRETEVKNALDLGDKCREKIKNASLVLFWIWWDAKLCSISVSFRYFKMPTSSNRIIVWKSKESIKPSSCIR